MELYGNSDCSSDCRASEGDVVSPLDSSQISNSTTSRKRLFSDVWNYFTGCDRRSIYLGGCSSVNLVTARKFTVQVKFCH